MKSTLKFIVIISCLTQFISAGPGQSKMALPPARPAWTAAIIASSEQVRKKTAAAATSKHAKETTATALVPVAPAPVVDKASLGRIMCNTLPAPLWKIIFGYMKDFNPSAAIKTFRSADPIHTILPMSDGEIISFSKPLYSANPRMNYSQVHVWNVDNERPAQSWAQKLSPWTVTGVHQCTAFSNFEITKVDNQHFITHFDDKAQLRHKNQPEKLREVVYGLSPIECILFGTRELVVIHSNSVTRFNLQNEDAPNVIIDEKKMREILKIKDVDGNDVPFQLHWGAAKMDDQHMIVSFEMSPSIGYITDYGRWSEERSQFVLILVNKNTGEITRRYPIKSFVAQIHRLDDKHFISSNFPETRFGGNLATLWHVDSQEPLRALIPDVGQQPSCIKVVDENHFMIGDKRGIIFIYHKDNEDVDAYDLESGEVTGIDTMGENHLITSHADNTIKLWLYDYVRSTLEAIHAACIVSASKLPATAAAKSKATIEVIS